MELSKFAIRKPLEPQRCIDCGSPAYAELDGLPDSEARCWECAAREAEEFAAEHWRED